MSIYEGDSGSERPEGGLLSRRDLLGRAAVGTAGLGAASLLAGTPAIAKAAASKVAAATPKHGGTVTMAINTDGAGDTFDPGLAGSPSDVVRLYLAFDPLVRLAPDLAGARAGAGVERQQGRHRLRDQAAPGRRLA